MNKNKKCITCQEYERCRDSFSSWIFFIIGLIATIAIRVVTVLIHLNPIYGKIAWYIGISGFLVFFIYKFKVGQARSRLIEKGNLMEKINHKRQLNDEDYKAMSAVLCALTSKKERINYFFIFGLSAVALILAVYFDFVK